MPNLMSRVLTSIGLIAVVLLAVFYLPKIEFGLLTGIAAIIAGWEWSSLVCPPKKSSRYNFMFDFVTLLVLSAYLPVFWVLVAGLVAAVLGFFRYYKIAGLFMLPACWKAINYLCFLSPHPYKLLSLLLIVYLADSAAYFVGNKWGKHKLAPTISPGKSVEGAAGALVVVGIVAAVIFHSVAFVLLALVTVVVSILGDLLESALKRQKGVKDSGKILPGHGGLLDRIDSLLIAAPVFTLGIMWLR